MTWWYVLVHALFLSVRVFILQDSFHMAERSHIHPFGAGVSEKKLGTYAGKPASLCFPTSIQCFANVLETDRSHKFWEFHLWNPVKKLDPLDSARQEGFRLE